MSHDSDDRLSRPGWRLAAALTSLLAVSAPTAADANPMAQFGWWTPPNPPNHEVTFHWVVGTSRQTQLKIGGDPQSTANFHGAPIRRDMQMFGEANFGDYPFGGPHQVQNNPDWMRRHFARVAAQIDEQIPDPNWDGNAIIDYEAWNFCWIECPNDPSPLGPDARDRDFKDDWRDYINTRRPELVEGKTKEQKEIIYQQTFDQASKDFILATLNESKRLRPNTKWGFYDYPIRRITEYKHGPTQKEKIWNDTYYAWVWENVDLIFLSVYSLAWAQEHPHDLTKGYPMMTPEINAQYIGSVVAEGVRLARGKPVYAGVMFVYEWLIPVIGDKWVNGLNLRQMIEVPYLCGATGVAFWGYIPTWEYWYEFQQYMTEHAMPEVLRVVAMATAAGGQTGSGGGGGNGGPNSGTGRPPGLPVRQLSVDNRLENGRPGSTTIMTKARALPTQKTNGRAAGLGRAINVGTARMNARATYTPAKP